MGHVIFSFGKQTWRSGVGSVFPYNYENCVANRGTIRFPPLGGLIPHVKVGAGAHCNLTEVCDFAKRQMPSCMARMQ